MPILGPGAAKCIGDSTQIFALRYSLKSVDDFSREVTNGCRFLSQGRSNRELAGALVLSERIVEKGLGERRQ